jgi:hypothetical protein
MGNPEYVEGRRLHGGDINWTELAQNKALVNTAMNVQDHFNMNS